MNFLKPTRTISEQSNHVPYNIDYVAHKEYAREQGACVCSDSIFYTLETSVCYSIILPFSTNRLTFTYSPPAQPPPPPYQFLCTHVRITENYVITSQVKSKCLPMYRT